MATSKKTEVELGLTKTESGKTVRAVLELTTGKGFRKDIRSSAQVMWEGEQFRSCLLCGDYSVEVEARKGVATQKAIDTQHAEVFTDAAVATLVDAARSFYAGKEGA